MGKSSSIAMVAMKFVDEVNELEKFDFVWTVRLKNVDITSSLAELIQNQHENLKTFPTVQIASILKGKTESKVALLLDGYDEYQPGKNKDIDTAIESGVGNCVLVLTSRPGYVSEEIKNKMDTQVNIEGLSIDNIKKCAELYLDCKIKNQEMLKQATYAGIFHPRDSFIQKFVFWKSSDTGLFRIPILLLMSCFIYERNQSLPKSKTDIVKTLYSLLGDRTEVRATGMTSADTEKYDEILTKLGKLAWEALKKDQLVLFKVRLLQFPIHVSPVMV